MIVLDEDQIDHQLDHFARGEVFPGGFVRDFRELADQFLENQSHLGVGNGLGMKIDVDELFGDQIEQSGFAKSVDLGLELKSFEDVSYRRREGLDVGHEVFADVVLIPHEFLHVQGGGVVEELAGFFEQEWFGIDPCGDPFFKFGQDCRFGRFQNAIEAAQDSKRQDDLAILRLFVIPT